MELIEQTVSTQPSLTLPWDETMIMPVGDIQYGARGADLAKFKRHIEWGVKMGAYFTGLGDYLDVASPSGRKKLRDSDLYDSVTDSLDSRVRQQLDDLKRVLEPSQGRWLALNKGHHYWTFMNEDSPEYGRDTDDLLAEFLGCPVASGAALAQIRFRGETGRRAVTCQILQAHGEGSGVTMAAPLNKLERLMSRFPSVDVFLIGHYSRKAAYPVDALVPIFGKEPRLKAKRRILCVTGGFMRGWEVGNSPSYVERAMLPPTNLGGALLRVRPVHTNYEDRLDMSVEL